MADRQSSMAKIQTANARAAALQQLKRELQAKKPGPQLGGISQKQAQVAGVKTRGKRVTAIGKSPVSPSPNATLKVPGRGSSLLAPPNPIIQAIRDRMALSPYATKPVPSVQPGLPVAAGPSPHPVPPNPLGAPTPQKGKAPWKKTPAGMPGAVTPYQAKMQQAGIKPGPLGAPTPAAPGGAMKAAKASPAGMQGAITPEQAAKKAAKEQKPVPKVQQYMVDAESKARQRKADALSKITAIEQLARTTEGIPQETTAFFQGLPAPGGIALPLLLLIVLFLLVLPAKGADGTTHTRAMWLWRVMTSNASLAQTSTSTLGTITSETPSAIAQATANVFQQEENILQNVYSYPLHLIGNIQ